MRKFMPVFAAGLALGLAGCSSAGIDETIGSAAGLVATGVIPCSRDGGQGSCQFAVSQSGGNAEVTVSWPDGARRIIYFENGIAVRSDGVGAFSAEKKGGVSIVRVGNERYDVPDASLPG